MTTPAARRRSHSVYNSCGLTPIVEQEAVINICTHFVFEIFPWAHLGRIWTQQHNQWCQLPSSVPSCLVFGIDGQRTTDDGPTTAKIIVYLALEAGQQWSSMQTIVGYWLPSTSSSRMRVIYHNWSATKQRPHPQSVAEISHHSVLSGDRIRQCETSSGSRRALIQY